MDNVRLFVTTATEFLSEQYDLCIYALGYEQRSSHVAKLRVDREGRSISVGFLPPRMFAYEKNKQWYQTHGTTVVECDDAVYRNTVETAIREATSSDHAKKRILIDISSVTRYRLATLVEVCRDRSE